MIEKYLDAEELRRLLSFLGVILGCLIIGGLFAVIVVPGLRNANKPETPAAVVPVAGETGWLDPAEFPVQKGSVVPPTDPKTLMEATPELMSQGKTLYASNCVSCHGPAGRGDGPAASTMNPKPRNLAAPDGWKNGNGLAGVFLSLTGGIRGTSMASFDYLSRKDRMAIAHYVQSLGAFEKKEDPQALAALSNELASAGEIIPNKIPVSMAMSILEKEFVRPPFLEIGEDAAGLGAQTLRQAVVDPVRAAQTLVQNQSWRLSVRDLASTILAGAPGNGFSVGVATLNLSEWQVLHSELLQRVKTK